MRVRFPPEIRALCARVEWKRFLRSVPDGSSAERVFMHIASYNTRGLRVFWTSIPSAHVFGNSGIQPGGSGRLSRGEVRSRPPAPAGEGGNLRTLVQRTVAWRPAHSTALVSSF